MQISGEYGTELLIRYTEEQLTRDLERRRVAVERDAEHGAGRTTAWQTLGARVAALFRGRERRMPARGHAAPSRVTPAHR
ncbi:hypothetical protein IWX78_000587 [Mycetocola sp. CAN_C7]|uniref:hypothetical protein n=1 Tax=Mycetocola sp. CAN_C7 TaxID=2787724 RepID=UPI0018CAFA66